MTAAYGPPFALVKHASSFAVSVLEWSASEVGIGALALAGEKELTVAKSVKFSMVTLAMAVAGAWASAAGAEDAISTVEYACKDSKSIKAVYYSEKVDLTLSDGRAMSLPQTMSGSGIRYANADESLVFWSKGNTAFITEGPDADPTYEGCTET